MRRTFARSYFGDYFSGGFFYLGGAMKFHQIYVLLTLRTRRDRRLAGACARDAGAADACAAPARARHGARLDGGDPARATPGCLGTIAI
ncbi:MAG: hypothetical protein DMG07_05985 [Acidobacteria bacterium]|nr:MAG: hypothetical protein DMG07_05985 [Acidobacteriota bacterium]